MKELITENKRCLKREVEGGGKKIEKRESKSTDKRN